MKLDVVVALLSIRGSISTNTISRPDTKDIIAIERNHDIRLTPQERTSPVDHMDYATEVTAASDCSISIVDAIVDIGTIVIDVDTSSRHVTVKCGAERLIGSEGDTPHALDMRALAVVRSHLKF